MAQHLDAAGYDPLVVGRGELGLARLRYDQPGRLRPRPDAARPRRLAADRDRARRGIGTPIVVVSARGTEHDRVHALEIGADDYLVKPFSMKELVARVGAAARRGVRPAEQQRGDAIEIEELLIDPREVQAFVDGANAELTPTEFRLSTRSRSTAAASSPATSCCRRCGAAARLPRPHRRRLRPPPAQEGRRPRRGIRSCRPDSASATSSSQSRSKRHPPPQPFVYVPLASLLHKRRRAHRRINATTLNIKRRRMSGSTATRRFNLGNPRFFCHASCRQPEIGLTRSPRPGASISSREWARSALARFISARRSLRPKARAGGSLVQIFPAADRATGADGAVVGAVTPCAAAARSAGRASPSKEAEPAEPLGRGQRARTRPKASHAEQLDDRTTQ